MGANLPAARQELVAASDLSGHCSVPLSQPA